MTDVVQNAPKRRGRKPKSETIKTDLTKVSKLESDATIDEKKTKKKQNVASLDETNHRNLDNIEDINEPIILHLNIRSSHTSDESLEKGGNDIKNINYEKSFYEYDPIIEEPNAYNVETTFSSIPENVSHDDMEQQNVKMNDNNNTNNNTLNIKSFFVNKKLQNDNEDKKHDCLEETSKSATNDKLKDIIQVGGWSELTNVACYWDCHTFTNYPVGIPIKYKDNTFHVFGCFCSLECAVSYNFHSNENVGNVWERYNLINLMAQMMNYKSNVKPAMSRKCLKLFGGKLNIQDFRKNNIITNPLSYPMVSIVEQIEEINDFHHKKQTTYIPLDRTRIEKIEEANKDKHNSKQKSVLEESMNLKYIS